MSVSFQNWPMHIPLPSIWKMAPISYPLTDILLSMYFSLILPGGKPTGKVYKLTEHDEIIYRPLPA